ncbi:glycine--tRNA ligase subunit beta, partial [Prochlorococcus sp. AH-736-L19]
LQGPRFMKWGTGNIKFSRPIRWITSIYNDEILDFAFDQCDPNIQISNKSKSHRLINEVFEVHNPEEFFELLKQKRVLVKRNERKEKIESLINQASLSLNLKPDLSEGLLNELIDLVEWPDLIIGKFSEEFLDLPLEVLSTVMKSHQRYVPLLLKNNSFSKLDLSSEKNISTNFLVISNGLEESNKNIARGNEKVLRARFSDAKFFVESDKKVASIVRNEKLKSVSYLKGLGNIFQRVERIVEVTKKILIILNDNSLEDEKIIEAARYCKNDLCSEIVYEFPELQGIMGGKYLKNEGFSEDICLAVAEHYLPAFYKDALPSTRYGAIVSMADKIETLISIFISGKRPSGSSDPYALRRNLNGVIKIIWDYEFDLPLDNLFKELIDFWKITFPELNFSKETVSNDLNQFLVQRIESHLEEISLGKELIKAVCSSDEFSQERILNIVDLKNRIKSILDFKEKESFVEIQKVITRVSKLANSSTLSTEVLLTRNYVNTKLFEKDCEFKVFEFIRELENNFSKGYSNYLELLNLFEIHINTIEDLFDNEKGVLVMTEDVKIRNNRLNLLSLIRNYSLKIVDFTLLNS